MHKETGAVYKWVSIFSHFLLHEIGEWDIYFLRIF